MAQQTNNYGYETSPIYGHYGKMYILPEMTLCANSRILEADLGDCFDLATKIDLVEILDTFDISRELGLSPKILASKKYLDEKIRRDLEKELEKREAKLDFESRSHFVNIFPNFPESVQILTKSLDSKDFSKFLEQCLKFHEKEAVNSVKLGLRPNYLLEVPRLIEDIQTFTGVSLDVQNIPETIVGHTTYDYGFRIPQASRPPIKQGPYGVTVYYK